MDINNLPAGYFAGGDVEACPNCGNRIIDSECIVCGYVHECPNCENVLDAGEVCNCTNEHARDLHDRERNDDDGREYGHPGDAKREREDDDDRWLWHRMQAEFSAWGTK